MSIDTHNPYLRILGVPVSVLTMPRLVNTVITWAQQETPRKVLVRDVASLMLAVDDSRFRSLHEHADMVTPDGMPLAWCGKLRGFGHAIERVSGADIVDAVCTASLVSRQRHYFYGGRPGVAEEMAQKLSLKYPGLRVAGIFCPPMRDIGPDFELTSEIRAELDAIRNSDADFVWMGLSSPKQDYFIMKASPYVGRGVFFAVGAAFDFHAGTIRRAPVWMRRSGLEWLCRLTSEPRRLWRRYLVLAPKFVCLIALESLGMRT